MAPHPSILLIEDSPGECELFRLALDQSDLPVTLQAEPDCETAYRSLAGGVRPTLILLDLNLRGKHGCDFLKRLRADGRFATIPVVIFTTSDAVTDLTHCYADGANGYVVKPSTYEDLVRCIRDLCGYWVEWNRSPPGSPYHTTEVGTDRYRRS